MYVNDGLTLWKINKLKVPFILSTTPQFAKKALLFDGLQVSHVFSSSRRVMCMKMNMALWWKDTDRRWSKN